MASQATVDAGRDPRDAFDAASLPGMRDRLATWYTEFRRAEASANRERSPPEHGGRVGSYRDRACPCCGAESSIAPVVQHAHGLSIVACPNCSFVYSRNVMDGSSDAARYRVSDIDRITMSLRDAAPYLELEVARARYYLARIADAGIGSGTLLEIGCGSGTFLIEAARSGLNGFGIEPGIAASLQARDRGASVVDGYFPKDLPSPEVRFDLVAMLDVLEHLVEPRPLLREIKARLGPGGLLFVQVPNWESLLVQVEGERSTIVAPGHWSYFTRDSLTRLVSDEGFETVHAETVVSELDRIAAHDEARICETLARLRPSAEASWPMDAAGLYRLGLGYKLIAIFRNPDRR